MPKVAVGGTFEYLHDGHKRLIRTAFKIAGNGEIHIGLTSDQMAGQKERQINDYTTRRSNLKEYIKSLDHSGTDYIIFELKDPYGTTVVEDYDYIVVSPETHGMALKINQLRKEGGREPIEIVSIEYVLADDEIPISSTRISKGEIDIHGHLKRNECKDNI